MNILIVDDQPDLKVQHALDYLNSKKIKFDYELFSCVNSALRYFNEHSSEIDLAIVDLGLPMFEGGRVRSPVEGVIVIQEILDQSCMEDLNIPIIINSTTKIEGSHGETEEEYFEIYYTRELETKIEHVSRLEGSWLYKFLQENLKDKLEFI